MLADQCGVFEPSGAGNTWLVVSMEQLQGLPHSWDHLRHRLEMPIVWYDVGVPLNLIHGPSVCVVPDRVESVSG